ncbi:hypothetical protein K4F52_004854 [Lecanicillium sp. MT-2017a]|nr:hypothetical protein K4F52_004854 [Lecanicillium sp. MT-2017a]
MHFELLRRPSTYTKAIGYWILGLALAPPGDSYTPEIHALAEEITMRNGMAASVRSINGDFTKMALPGPVDHIVSFLCILHIADRDTLFKKAAAMLPTGGKIYIEDFFAREALTSASQDQLRDVVSCSYLPSEKRYLADMESAGFRDVHFQDVSAEWSDYVRARAIEYRKCASRQDAMLAFYDTVNELFASGQVGGVRITAAKA